MRCSRGLNRLPGSSDTYNDTACSAIILHLQGLFMTRAACPVRVIIRATLRPLVGMDDLGLLALNDERSRAHAANQLLCFHRTGEPLTIRWHCGQFRTLDLLKPRAHLVPPCPTHVRASCITHVPCLPQLRLQVHHHVLQTQDFFDYEFDCQHTSP